MRRDWLARVGFVFSGFGLAYSWWKLLSSTDEASVLTGAMVCMVGLMMVLVSDRKVR